MVVVALPSTTDAKQSGREIEKHWVKKHKKPLIAVASILGVFGAAAGGYALYLKKTPSEAESPNPDASQKPLSELPEVLKPSQPKHKIRKKLADVDAKTFKNVEIGFQYAEKYLSQADIVYVSMGAGDQKKQICPDFLKDAANAGRQVVIVSLDPLHATQIDSSANIKHIHIKSYLLTTHIKHFAPRGDHQEVIFFDGTITSPNDVECSSKVTKAILQSFDGDNVSVVVQTLGLVKNMNELKAITDETNEVERKNRQLNLHQETGYSLNQFDGEANLNRVMREKLDLD